MPRKPPFLKVCPLRLEPDLVERIKELSSRIGINQAEIYRHLIDAGLKILDQTGDLFAYQKTDSSQLAPHPLSRPYLEEIVKKLGGSSNSILVRALILYENISKNKKLKAKYSCLFD